MRGTRSLEDLDSGLVSVNEAAAILKVARATVYSEIERGRLRSTKVGRLRRISRAAIAKYLEEGERR